MRTAEIVHAFAPLRSCNARATDSQVTAPGARTTLSLRSEAQQAGLQASEEKTMANSPSHADAAADGTTEFAFKATFDVMKARQSKRRSYFANFAYIMQRPGTAVYLLGMVAGATPASRSPSRTIGATTHTHSRNSAHLGAPRHAPRAHLRHCMHHPSARPGSLSVHDVADGAAG